MFGSLFRAPSSLSSCCHHFCYHTNQSFFGTPKHHYNRLCLSVCLSVTVSSKPQKMAKFTKNCCSLRQGASIQGAGSTNQAINHPKHARRTYWPVMALFTEPHLRWFILLIKSIASKAKENKFGKQTIDASSSRTHAHIRTHIHTRARTRTHTRGV